jgi:hypothetical protein
MSYAIPNFLPFPSSITTTTITTTARPTRTIGILKRDPLEQIPVDTRRKSWKKLPVPDLNQNQMGNRSTRWVASRCSGCSSVPSDGVGERKLTITSLPCCQSIDRSGNRLVRGQLQRVNATNNLEKVASRTGRVGHHEGNHSVRFDDKDATNRKRHALGMLVGLNQDSHLAESQGHLVCNCGWHCV